LLYHILLFWRPYLFTFIWFAFQTHYNFKVAYQYSFTVFVLDSLLNLISNQLFVLLNFGIILLFIKISYLLCSLVCSSKTSNATFCHFTHFNFLLATKKELFYLLRNHAYLRLFIYFFMGWLAYRWKSKHRLCNFLSIT
jgi:hypothetical protein